MVIAMQSISVFNTFFVKVLVGFPGRAHGQLGGTPSTSQKRMSSSGHQLELTPSGRSALGSPIDRASTLSTSTELGGSSWRISQYERNPPAEDGDLGAHSSDNM